jgi:tetratricopeptide (TPR) repeat protein
MNTPRAVALCQCFKGALEFQAGHWPEAEAALTQSIQLYREIGAASGEALACQRLGVLQTARGQLNEGLSVLQEGVAVAERALMRAHCLTRIYAAMARNRLAAGELAEADQVLELGLAMSRRHGHCTTCDALLLPAAVNVRVAQGRFESAEIFCRQLEQAAQEYASRAWVAMAYQARGELAAGRGEIDKAIGCFIAGQRAFLGANNRYEAAHCLLALADLYHRQQTPERLKMAEVAQREAEQIFAQLGAT